MNYSTIIIIVLILCFLSILINYSQRNESFVAKYYDLNDPLYYWNYPYNKAGYPVYNYFYY
jgi:hypothetical protein